MTDYKHNLLLSSKTLRESCHEYPSAYGIANRIDGLMETIGSGNEDVFPELYDLYSTVHIAYVTINGHNDRLCRALVEIEHCIEEIANEIRK